jgi:putative transposase
MHRYFVTVCTAQRERLFRAEAAVALTRSALVESAQRFDFDLVAYCFMPDHLHLLVAARTEGSNLVEMVRIFKQVSAFRYRYRMARASLWQFGYFERVLRDDEETIAVARYILENPVRARLTRRFQDYPFSGSALCTMEALADLWR